MRGVSATNVAVFKAINTYHQPCDLLRSSQAEYDIVVVNTDPSVFRATVLSSENKDYDWDESATLSTSAVALHFGLSTPLPSVQTHNVFLRPGSKSWWPLDDRPVADLENFNFYLHAPCRTDPTAATGGGDAITVLVPWPTFRRDKSKSSAADYEDMSQVSKP